MWACQEFAVGYLDSSSVHITTTCFKRKARRMGCFLLKKLKLVLEENSYQFCAEKLESNQINCNKVTIWFQQSDLEILFRWQFWLEILPFPPIGDFQNYIFLFKPSHGVINNPFRGTWLRIQFSWNRGRMFSMPSTVWFVSHPFNSYL